MKVKKPAEAVALLVECMANKTGQSYKVRNLLYSLWNGKACAALIETRCLDHELRLALCIVILNFGDPGFDYDQISDPIKAVGLFDWFIEEGGGE